MGFDAVEIPVEYPEKISAKKVREALHANGLLPSFAAHSDLRAILPMMIRLCMKSVSNTFFNVLISVTNGMQSF